MSGTTVRGLVLALLGSVLVAVGGTPPAAGTTGLYHVAFLYPTRAALAVAVRRLREAGVEINGASDHGGSEAIYLCDPDGNGLELYWDRPQEHWPRTPDGALMLVNSPLDLDDLLNECEIANSA